MGNDEKETIILFFERSKGLAKVSVYNSEGKLVEEKEYNPVKLIEFKGVKVRSFQGMSHNITMYVIEGGAVIEFKNTVLRVGRGQNTTTL